MKKREFSLYDCENLLDNEDKTFLQEMDDYLTRNNFKLKAECTNSGYKCSYCHTKTRRAIAIFSTQYDGLHVHIYADCLNGYDNFIQNLPKSLLELMKKGPNCRELDGRSACKPWGYRECAGGYEYVIDGSRYKKCRFNNFKFKLCDENREYIKSFIKHECEAREGA
jgi:hypothetical protein